MTRVLQVVGHAAGGIGVHVADLSAHLSATDRVRVVAPAATAARFDLGDVDVAAWPERRDPRQALPALARLRALVRGSDVVHAHGHQAGLTALLAAAGTGVPVVVSWHNAILARRGPGAVAERWQARRAALVTGASRDLVDRALELGARRAELAPVAAPAAGSYDGSRAQARASIAEVLDVEPRTGEVWALTVSRIAPQKDLGVLVDAARLLHESGTRNLRWLVVGDGDDDLRDALALRVRDLPVHLVGARADVPTWMAASDLLVVPSRWEARALVVQEALAASLPVVATDVGGLPELVHGCGELVPVGDARALADAVAGLASDPERRERLGVLARERFMQLPGPADVAAAWRERYATLAPSRR